MCDFATELPTVRGFLVGDVRAAYQGDPAATNLYEILLGYPGTTAIIYHRLAHSLYRHGVPLVARLIADIARSKTGIDIHPGADIGPNFFIDHGTGVVIGETTIIGERVRIYQAVTLGARSFPSRRQWRAAQGQCASPDHRRRRGHLCRRHDFGTGHGWPRLDYRRQCLAHA